MPCTDAMASNGMYFFQVAYCADSGDRILTELSGSAAAWAKAYEVLLVPSQLPAYPGYDDHVERTTPGLFPDPIREVPAYGIPVSDCGGWRSIYIVVDGKDKPLPEGKLDLTVSLVSAETGECKGQQTVALEVFPALDPQKLLYTCWIYFDCIAQAHHVEIWSDAFWEIAENYLQLAGKFGMNVVLTPLLTPPLETAVGLYRPAVQLVDVLCTEDGYAFSFQRFDRFAAMAQRAGMRYFEITHLFSQWGASSAAQVIGVKDGKEQRIFGWDDRADGPAYQHFLDSLLRAFGEHVRKMGLDERCLYHVSDEPWYEVKEAYCKGRKLLENALGSDIRIIDAMSDYKLYEEGAVTTPVPALDAIGPFVENHVKPLWGYYCCVQGQKVSNRFFSMPLSRTRVLGVQMYLADMEGFLHWGYNHYNAQQSREVIDPYHTTDARLAFPSGDAFCVYPVEKGATPSIRMAAFYEGIEDMQLMQTAERLHGRAYVEEIIRKEAGMDITFTEYPRDAAFLPKLRRTLLQSLKGGIAQ